MRIPLGYGGYSRRRGGGKGRLIIAAVMALFALGTFFFSTQTNPITGKSERVALSPADETRLGLSSAPEMAQQMGGAVPESDPRARLVSAVGNRLLDESGLRRKLAEADVPWQFTFTLLGDERTVNAFALPGGPVFITEALFAQLENEAQLAGVLGHEIGHVVERHGAERMAKQQLGQGLIGAATVGTGDYSAAQVGAVVNNVIQSSYSREQELESDEYGLQYLVDAGYDPREMVRVMEILKAASGGRGGGAPEFMQTHPHPESRIEAIKKFVGREFPDGVPETLSTGQALR